MEHVWLYLAPINAREAQDDAYANAAEYLYDYAQMNYPVLARPDDETNVMFVIAQ